MYVSGRLSESDTVLVDVGTGYYIDMVRVVFVSNSVVISRNTFDSNPVRQLTRLHFIDV